MPIENAQYISQLDIANPSGSDQVAELDNHIRLIKQVLKNSFPNVGAAVSSSAGELSRLVPIGIIALWSGALTAIPTGWVLCAGQQGLNRSDDQGTINAPDLRGKFVAGAGDPAGNSGYPAVASTGGSATHNHTGTVGGTAITVAQLPAHNHGVTDPGHGHNISDPGHSHAYSYAASGAGVAGGVGALAWGGLASSITAGAGTGISIIAGGTGITIQNNGSGQTHTHGLTVDNASSLPPYLALAFIMKI